MAAFAKDSSNLYVACKHFVRWRVNVIHYMLNKFKVGFKEPFFFKNRLRQSLTKFNFLTKIIKVSNICYFWRVFQNIYQNANWPVNIFVIISWSKEKLLTLLYLGVSYLRWVLVQTQLSRLTTYFSQLQSRWNRVVFPVLPMLQMFLFQCFKWKFTSPELLEKNWWFHLKSRLF